MRTVPFLLRLLLLSTFACCTAIPAFAQNAEAPKPGAATIQAGSPWLFAGFKLNSEDGVYYAISLDGYHWKLANGGKPVVPPTIPGELMRDPFIRRAPDGSFRMVWTWAWYDPHVIGYAESRDLVHWTPHREIPVMSEPGAANVWAPAMYYEPAKEQWLIFWASTIPGRFPGDDSGDTAKLPGGASVGLNHRIYFTTTPDFKTFSPAKVFFDPGYSVIDATLLPPTAAGKPFTLIFKDERKNPVEKHLLTATGPSFEGPWSNISQPISETWSEVRRSSRFRQMLASQLGSLPTTTTTPRDSTMGPSSLPTLSIGQTRSRRSTSPQACGTDRSYRSPVLSTIASTTWLPMLNRQPLLLRRHDDP